MSDGGIREQPTNAGLDDGGKVPDQHRNDGNDCQQGQPSGNISVPIGASFRALKTSGHNTREDKQTGHFRSGSDERGAGDRRSLVNVRSPKMEWGGGDLESEPDNRH